MIDDSSKHDFVRFLMDEGALRFGEFTLKSGGKSPFFINLGDICSGKALQYVGKAFARCIKDDFGGADILFGPPYKGITLSAAAAIEYQQMYGQKIYTCYNRKEAKGHGERGMFVGRVPEKSDRIIVIDDVLTTGGTKVEAIKMIETAFDVNVAGIAVAVDRRIKGADAGLNGYPMSSIISLPDIAAFLQDNQMKEAQTITDFYEGRYHG